MKLLLANPRGFCAGVERAVRTVEKALELYGSPIYVRHEIVHNQHVVQELKEKGVIFVEELSEVPDNTVVIFSAHGVSKKVTKEGNSRRLHVIDATCPLVTKVHMEAHRNALEGREQVLIGHAGHPEVEGTMGQVDGGMHLVSSTRDVETLDVKNAGGVAFVTQTTLSMDDMAEIVTALKKRFPGIRGPMKKNICYATQNRQNAVKDIIKEVHLLIVVGASNSSNSNRLRELGEKYGVASYLVGCADDIRPQWIKDASRIGVTAGASAPEHIVRDVLKRLKEIAGKLEIKEIDSTDENVKFNLPI
ncbi:MAG: 4-hydroxy-3-methylbut-2-enyl diphosphate reductase [Thermodesulfobacteriota bacterium]|nr:MAG: 4-hydroxy-3-methylbut-2-enyl diphosphate reductase [Thermodesulfobacteriota bacterium]